MKLHVVVLIFGTILTSVVGWECTKPGRFPDPEEEDGGCELYVTCIPNGDGTFTMRNDQCGPDKLFSAAYQRCIAGDSCDSLEDFYSIQYECKECGKFVNVKSQDCRQFVNCLKTTDPGVFVPIKQRCPKDQVFSAKTLTCVDESEYQCPPIVLKFLSDFVCLDVGQYPDESIPNCRGYRLCSRTDNGNLVSQNFLCTNETVFSEIERKCVSADDYDCPDDGNTGFICPGVGRYPDKVSKTCETFHTCVENAKGELKSSLSTCPGGTIFSAITSKCVASSEYVCPTTLAELELFEQYTGNGPVAAARRVANEEEVALCAESGRFPNEDDLLCESYYLCSRDQQNNWFKVSMKCPAGSVFSSDRKRCVDKKEFVCPSTTTLADLATITSTANVVEPSDTSTLECTTIGRLPNSDDKECKTYFLCSFNSENLLTRTQYNCPRGTLFSIDLNKCVDGNSFHCPGALYITTSDSVDQSGDGIGTAGVTQVPEEEYTSGAELLAGDASPTSLDDAEFINATTTMPTSYEYPCTATGRFADINSVDCRSYFLCTEDKSGSIVSVHLNCPGGMVFSRNENKCVVSTKYLC